MGPVNANVDMKTWIKLFETLDLDVDFEALNDACQSNNFQVSEGLLSNILNNLSFSDWVKVKAHMKLSAMGGDLSAGVSGGIINGVPDAMVATVAIVALLLAYNRSNVMMAIVLVGGMAAYVCSRGPTGTPQTTGVLVDPRAERGSLVSDDGNQCPETAHLMMLLKDKSLNRVTPQQVVFCESLVQSRQSHVVVTKSGYLVSAFVAKANSGEDLSFLSCVPGSTLSKQSANEQLKQKLDNLNTSVCSCEDFYRENKTSLCDMSRFQGKMARVSKGWILPLQRLDKDYGGVLGRMKSMMRLSEDFAVSRLALRQRNQLFTKMQDKVAELIEQTEAIMDKKTVMTFTDDTVQASRQLLKSIIYSTAETEKLQEQLVIGMKESDDMFRRRHEASSSLEAERARVASLKKEIAGEKLAFERQTSLLENDIQSTGNAMRDGGQGYWMMDGSPNDPKSQRLTKAWDSANFEAVASKEMGAKGFYESGSFVCRWVNKLSEGQKEVRVMSDALEKKLAEKREAFQQATAPKKAALAACESSVKNLEVLADTAGANYLAAENRLTEGVHLLPKVEIARALLLQQVAAAMKATASYIQPCQPELEEIEELLSELHFLLEEKGSVKKVLEAVMALNTAMADPEVSNMMLLSTLGTTQLAKFLLPAVDPNESSMTDVLSPPTGPVGQLIVREVD